MSTLTLSQLGGSVVTVEVPAKPAVVEIITKGPRGLTGPEGPEGPPGTPGNEFTEMITDPLAYYILAKA